MATWTPEAAPCTGPASSHACNTGMGPKPPRRVPHLLGHTSGAAHHPPAAAARARFVEGGGAWWRQALTINDGPRGKVAALVSAFKAMLYVAPWPVPSGRLSSGLFLLLAVFLFELKQKCSRTLARTTASGLELPVQVASCQCADIDWERSSWRGTQACREGSCKSPDKLWAQVKANSACQQCHGQPPTLRFYLPMCWKGIEGHSGL